MTRPQYPVVVALYDKIVKMRRFSIWLCALVLIVFQVEQNTGMMSAKEAYSRLYYRLPHWTRIEDFLDDNACYNITGY
jgi:hypothetical protein